MSDPEIWKSWGLKQKGTAALQGGKVTVLSAAVQADSVILLTPLAPSMSLGLLSVGNVQPGQSFDILSANVLDGSTVQWAIV